MAWAARQQEREALETRRPSCCMKDMGARILACLSLYRKLQHRSHLGESGRRPHHGDERSLLVKFFVEPDDDDVDELRVADDVAKFTELVAYGLDVLAVEVDRSITLGHVAELGM